MSLYEKANFQNIVLASTTTTKTVTIVLFDEAQLQRAISVGYTIQTSGENGKTIALNIIGTAAGAFDYTRIVGAQILLASGDIYASVTGLLVDGSLDDVGTPPTATTGITIAGGSYYSAPVCLGRIE